MKALKLVRGVSCVAVLLSGAGFACAQDPAPIRLYTSNVQSAVTHHVDLATLNLLG